MKIVVDRATLAEEMRHVLRVVGSGTVIAMLPYVRLDIHEGALRFFATDLETSIITSCATEIERAGGCCIEAKLLARFVSDAPSDVIGIDVEGGYATLTAGASSSLKAPVRHVDEFPTMPELEDVEATAELPAALFAKLIGSVIYAADPVGPRDFCKGPIVTVSGRRIDIAATDSYRIAMASAEADVTGDVRLVLRLDTAKAFLSLELGDDDALSLSVASNHVFLVSGTRTIVGRRIDTSIPNLDEYAARGAETYVIATDTLTRAVGRAAQALTARGNALALDFAGTKLFISAASARGVAEEECAMDSRGKAIRIGYSATYLRDACAAINSSSTAITLKERGADGNTGYEMTLRPEPAIEGIEETHLIMSMRIAP